MNGHDRQRDVGDGAHEVPATDCPEIEAVTPGHTADVAYLRIGDVRLTVDPSTIENRRAALDTLDRLARAVVRMERSLRYIPVAREHRDGDAR